MGLPSRAAWPAGTARDCRSTPGRSWPCLPWCAAGCGRRPPASDIAVGDHRDGHRLLDRPDAVPVRLAAVHLGPGPAVDRHGGGPRLLQDLANSTQLQLPMSQPRRNLAVTGTETAFTTASMMRPAFSGSFIRAAPSPLPTIFPMGQPMFRSTMSAPSAPGRSGPPRPCRPGRCRRSAPPRVLPRELLQQGQRLLVVIAQGLGGDELRDGISRPQLRADLAEGDVRDPGHGGQGQAGIDGDSSDVQGGPSFPMKT